MKRRIVSSLLLLFVLFSSGVIASLWTSQRFSKDLQSIITLHRIEIIRQNFVIDLQTVQSNLYTIGTSFGPELDMIIENVLVLHEEVNGCLSCHHDEEMTTRLEGVHELSEQYKEAISYLVTSTANRDRVERLKTVAVAIGDSLLSQSQEMAEIAEKRLATKTETVLKGISGTRVILIVTLIGTLILSIVIASMMTRKVTEPVGALLNAARKIGEGELGYQTSYSDTTEFGELAVSFNRMSRSLKEQQERTSQYILQLAGLHEITLASSGIDEMALAYDETCRLVTGLFRARECFLTLFDRERNSFVVTASALGLGRPSTLSLSVSRAQMAGFYRRAGGTTTVVAHADREDFGPLWAVAGEQETMIAWLTKKDEIVGAIVVAGRDEPFTEEDSRILTILSNHLAVTAENLSLFRNLQEKMQELREMQEQLIQSAKLAAIGELSANIAHEINNPLTSIIGYTEIALEEEQMSEELRKSLQIVEKESLRAKDIVRQLLDFARKKELKVSEIDLNNVIREVMQLVSTPARKHGVTVSEEYAPLPKITADADQLKQVFLNIINNGIAAMEQGGSFFISTGRIGEYVSVTFRDTGPGMPPEVLSRIFEPFFTTKREKGTGLGLSISYRIIRDHGGRIDVDSAVGKGTTFTIRLPQERSVASSARTHA